MLMTMLFLLMAATAVMWLHTPAKPQPVRARRNLLQEDLLASYIRPNDTRTW